MENDVEPKQDSSDLPNYGTKHINSSVEANVALPTNLGELHAEFKQYKLLKKKDELNSDN